MLFFQMLLSFDKLYFLLALGEPKNGFCFLTVEGMSLDLLCLEIEKVNLQVQGARDLSTCSNN